MSARLHASRRIICRSWRRSSCRIEISPQRAFVGLRARGVGKFVRFLRPVCAVGLFGSCRSLYFQPAGEPPAEVPSHQLAAWPDREYWSGIVFNGEKIGFSPPALGPANKPGTFELRSDAAFVLTFMGYTKRFNLKSYDLVRENLDLIDF